MIPIRDRNPSGTFPLITVIIILINVLTFLFELSLGRNLTYFLFSYGIVPLKIFQSADIPEVNMANTYFPFLSYMFLHGGLIHLLGNMWYLWIFGDNIEDILGRFGFVVFYLICGIGSAVVYISFNRQSGVPCIGASGAVAGVLGAYMISYPRRVCWFCYRSCLSLNCRRILYWDSGFSYNFLMVRRPLQTPGMAA
ncbi:rhomboid family intramembrane serine protease [Candidatus Kuenenia stuttgartensis]|uniref:rhomboid family intramembrane serine protease n=1 Tax=Kuenenia stuttgartiensis TaxID=174633 RepID=UPI001B8D36F4|nr:rhomboid family intramembrane serine protease [Candidatus Kuenenia stuttgartiensis]